MSFFGNKSFDIINYYNKESSQIQCEENNIFGSYAHPIIQGSAGRPGEGL